MIVGSCSGDNFFEVNRSCSSEHKPLSMRVNTQVALALPNQLVFLSLSFLSLLVLENHVADETAASATLPTNLDTNSSAVRSFCLNTNT